jgi:gliding motility-associated-like protein
LKTKLYILFFILSINTFSQRETDHWYFGGKAGLHFNKGNVDVLEDSQMTVLNGSSSISDTQGNLLFYTDGQTIWNKNHEIMTNGEGLNGELDNTQATIIVPKPNSTNTFYVFNTRKTELSTPLVYPMIYHSEIEFSTRNPLGWVKYKNMPLTHSTTNKITAVHHSNGKDIWVITYGSNAYEAENDIFYAIKVTEDGVERPFVKTQLEYVKYENSFDGEMKISPDGSTIALYNDGLIRFFNFDSTTGVLSKLKYVTIAEFGGAGYAAYGLTFSPDSKLLYYSASYSGQNYNIMQLEVANLDENYRGTPVYSGPLDRLQSSINLSTDGKIYIAQSNYKNILDVNGYYIGYELVPLETISIVHEPNKIGALANYEHEAINLKNGFSYRGLPNFIQSYFRNRIINDEKCITDVYNFNLDAYQTITAAKWDFGDGNTATGLTTNHQYTTPGTYIVTSMVTMDNVEVPFYKKIIVHPLPVVTPDQELIQCDTNNDGVDYFDLFDIGYKIVDDAFNKDFIFYRNKLDAENDENRIENPEIFENESNPQELFVRVISDKGCPSITNFFIESKFVKLGTIPNIYRCDSSDNINGDLNGYFDLKAKRVQIKDDFNLDDTNTIRFYPSLIEAQTTENEIVNKFNSPSTTIYVRVDTSLGCGGIEPFNLVVNSTPIINLNDNYTICAVPSEHSPIFLDGNSFNDRYEWRNNAGKIISTKKEFLLNSIGTFSLTAFKTENGLECSAYKEFTVTYPKSAEFNKITVDTETDNNTIYINLNGNSSYEFSLDNNIFYGDGTEYTFNNVTPGLRTIYVKDINNCEPSIQTNASVIGFKTFFSPNGDGNNDYWNLKGLDAANFKSIKIIVFDRYGKVLHSITDFNSLGWDGIYNGKTLSSNSYWFIAEIIDLEDHLIKKSGNFSLIRN